MDPRSIEVMVHDLEEIRDLARRAEERLAKSHRPSALDISFITRDLRLLRHKASLLGLQIGEQTKENGNESIK